MSNGTAGAKPVLTPRLVAGLCIVLLGVVLTFDRLGLVEADRVLRLWPAILIVIGALIVTNSAGSGRNINGIVLMIIGGWLLLTSIMVNVRFWELFWPLILILLGVNLARQAVRRKASQTSTDGRDRLSLVAILSGVKRTSASGHFQGGDVVAFMGGGQLDLRQATIAPGEEAVIDIVAVMGGFEIWVPSSWTLSTPIVPIMGGVDDKRLPALPTNAALSAADAPPPRLTLRGFVLMGGIQIKS